jgi:hypothetical protein
MKPVSKDTIRSGSFHGDLQVLTTDGKSYKFKTDDYAIVDDSIKGKGIQSGRTKSIPDKVFEGSIAIQDIEHSVADQFDSGGTVVFAALTVGIIVLLGIAISNFKPFGNGLLSGEAE